MDNSQKTTESKPQNFRWLAVTAGPVTRDSHYLEHGYKTARLSFRRLFDTAPDAMVLANTHGRIILVNSQTEQLFGYNRDELIGMQLEMLMPERFRDAHIDDPSGFAIETRTR